MTDDVEPGPTGSRFAGRRGKLHGDPEVHDDPEVGSGSADSARPPIDLAAALKQATWVDAVCLGGIAAAVLLGLLSYPLSAFLLAHIKVHLVATAALSALLTAGASVFFHTNHLSLLVVLAVIGLTKFDPFYFWAGRRYGDNLAQFLEETGGIRPRTVARAERWVGRFGPPLLSASYFLPVPSVLVITLLGASGVSWFAFALADLVGTLAWIAVFMAIGHHYHTQVHHVAGVVQHYSLLVGIGLLALVIVVTVVRSTRAARLRPPV